MKYPASDNYFEYKSSNNPGGLQTLLNKNLKLLKMCWIMTGKQNMRISTRFWQINAPKINDKVEINAGNYILLR